MLLNTHVCMMFRLQSSCHLVNQKRFFCQRCECKWNETHRCAESGFLKSHYVKPSVGPTRWVFSVLVESLAAWGNHMSQLCLPTGASLSSHVHIFFFLLFLHNVQCFYHNKHNVYLRILSCIKGLWLIYQKCLCKTLWMLTWISTNYWHLLLSHWASHVLPAGTLQWHIGFMSHVPAPCAIMHHLIRLCTSPAQWLSSVYMLWLIILSCLLSREEGRFSMSAVRLSFPQKHLLHLRCIIKRQIRISRICLKTRVWAVISRVKWRGCLFAALLGLILCHLLNIMTGTSSKLYELVGFTVHSGFYYSSTELHEKCKQIRNTDDKMQNRNKVQRLRVKMINGLKGFHL